jgi:succinate-semialdehyde dehydrogenase/glutarate-semialdehyde dehydrogenase
MICQPFLFLAKLGLRLRESKWTKIKSGDPTKIATVLGTLSSELAAVFLLNQLKRSIDEGAKVLLGGKHANGTFMEPTKLIDLKLGYAAFMRNYLFRWHPSMW